MANYNKYRYDKSVTELPDGSLVHYVVSTKWIKKWREFVNKRGGLPGVVNNAELASKIMNYREKMQYKQLHDNGIRLREPEDMYFLSEDFWSVFKDRYGCDV